MLGEVTYMIVEGYVHQQVCPIDSNIDQTRPFQQNTCRQHSRDVMVAPKEPLRERFTASHRASNILALFRFNQDHSG